MPKPRLDPEWVRRRGARHHFLAPALPATSPEIVVDRLVALHATDPATVHLSVHVRTKHATLGETAAALRDALEERRAVVRWLAMRGTLHVVGRADVASVRGVYVDRLAGPARRRAATLLEDAGIASSGKGLACFDDLVEAVVAALADGPATVPDLATRLPALSGVIDHRPDKSYGGRFAIGSHVVNAIGAQGVIARARGRGGWRNGQCDWARSDQWLKGEAASTVDPAQARAALAERYLSAFGPVTFDDLQWWTGWPKGMTRAALSALGSDVVEVEVGTHARTYLLRRADLEALRGPAPEEGPDITLLPGLDPTIMGYKHRSRFLDPAHLPELFDRNGNAGPTVWWDGRVIGAWAQRADGEIVWRLLGIDEDATLRDRLTLAATRLGDALGDERVRPRFPAPLQRQLQG